MPTGKSGRIGPDSDGPTIFEPNNWKRSGSDWTGAGSTDWMMSAPSEKRIDFKPFKHMTRMPTGKSCRIGPDSDGPTIFEPNNWKRSGSVWTGAGSTDWMMSAPSEKRIDFKPFKHKPRMPTGKSGRIGPDSDGPTIFEPNNWKRSGSDWTGAGSTDWMMSAP